MIFEFGGLRVFCGNGVINGGREQQRGGKQPKCVIMRFVRSSVLSNFRGSVEFFDHIFLLPVSCFHVMLFETIAS
jgi:hypothetical protein